MKMKPQYTLKELKKKYKIRHKKLKLNDIPCVLPSQKKAKYLWIKGTFPPNLFVIHYRV